MNLRGMLDKAVSNVEELFGQMKNCGPEKAVQCPAGEILDTSVVSGGGMFASIVTEVKTSKGSYAINGALNVNFVVQATTLKEWPVTGGRRYLIINDKEYLVAE